MNDKNVDNKTTTKFSLGKTLLFKTQTQPKSQIQRVNTAFLKEELVKSEKTKMVLNSEFAYSQTEKKEKNGASTENLNM